MTPAVSTKRIVLHTVPSLGISGGGPPRSVSQLCDALCTRSADKVAILTATYPNDPLVPLNPEIDLLTHAGTGTSLLARMRPTGFRESVERVIGSHEVLVVHQHGIWLKSSHEVTTVAVAHGIPLVISPRGMMEPWAMNSRKWKKRIAWALYQQRDLASVTAFHATALSEAQSVRNLGLKQPVAVIPNGIVMPPHTARHENVKRGKRTALFLSRINPKKGIPMLLEAWKALNPNDWQLLIAGNDDSNHLPEVLAKIDALGLAESVKVVGPLYDADKARAFEDADLFVLPSYSENFGIVVAEALSYGLPVLTTTGCPWAELVEERCGWWVEPVQSRIQEALHEAFSMRPPELQAMGERGMAMASAKYQWPGIAERMLVFYDWLANGGKQPAFVV